MKKILAVFIVILLLSQVFTVSAFAAGSMPVGGCLPGFELMPIMDHTGDMMDMHIGITVDLNGDGYICMKVISPDLHLHIDNTVPLS